ncbi:hypothetical protein TRVA0_019S02190 [Trichomonascus vanleenenianus]|uniref:uncharacterized protein n=1 Tax=Trichomonascus vanleenenianus TaxID=2268995 RepID=UPI003ECA4CA3
MFRIGLRAGVRSPIVTPRRGFKRIVITNPLGVRLLSISKKFLFVVAGVYTVGTVYFAGTYFATINQLKETQPVPESWSWRQTLLALSGAGHFEGQRYDVTVKYYEDLVNSLVLDKNGNPVDLDTKTQDWLAGYSDIVIRLGLAKEALGERDEAKEALSSGISIPFGQQSLKARAAIQLGRFEEEEGRIESAQSLYLEAVQRITPKEAIIETQSGIIVKPILHEINEAFVLSWFELGKAYVKQKNYKGALNLFLAIQRVIKETARSKSFKVERCYEQVAMSHISELLWVLGQKKDAVIWAEGAHNDANEKSRVSVECGQCAKMAAQNASKMYRHMSMIEQSEQMQERADNQLIIPTNDVYSEPFWVQVI